MMVSTVYPPTDAFCAAAALRLPFPVKLPFPVRLPLSVRLPAPVAGSTSRHAPLHSPRSMGKRADEIWSKR